MSKKLIVYDIECLPNFFCACFEDLESDKKIVCEISDRKDDKQMIKKIMKTYTLVGYNNKHYDDLLMHYILDHDPNNKDLYKLSKEIIVGVDKQKLYKFKFHRETDTIDLMTLLASSKLRVSLKHLQVKIKWDNVLEFECDWDKPLPKNRWDACIFYCQNDVSATKAVFKLKEKDYKLRLSLNERYKGTNADFRSKDGVSTAEWMMSNYISGKLGINQKEFTYAENERIDEVHICDIIEPLVNFNTKICQDTLAYFKSKTIYPKTSEDKKDKQLDYRIKIGNLTLDFGMGGLHSFHTGQYVKPDDKHYLIQSDISGYYPSQVIKLNYPHRLDPYFKEKYVEAYQDKAEGKRTGNKVQEALGKLIGNSTFGFN